MNWRDFSSQNSFIKFTFPTCSSYSVSTGIDCLSLLAWELVNAFLISFVNEFLVGRLLLYWFQNCSLLPHVWEVDEDEDDDEKLDTDVDLDLKESLGKQSLSLTATDPGEKELALSGVFLLTTSGCVSLLLTDLDLLRGIALSCSGLGR